MITFLLLSKTRYNSKNQHSRISSNIHFRCRAHPSRTEIDLNGHASHYFEVCRFGAETSIAATMMRTFSLLLLSLFTTQVFAGDCEVCGAGYSMTASDSVSFYAGVDTLTCGTLRQFASERDDTTDVCGIVQNYARTYCGCKDYRGNAAPPAPFQDNTVVCNICSGPNGSDLQTIHPDTEELIVDTGVSGFQAQCGYLYELGLSDYGAFSAGECQVVQNNVRGPCGCAITNNRGILGGPSPTQPAPSPTNAPPSPTPAPPSPTPVTSQCAGLIGSCDYMSCCSGLKCVTFPGYGGVCAPYRRLRGRAERPEATKIEMGTELMHTEAKVDQ